MLVVPLSLKTHQLHQKTLRVRILLWQSSMSATGSSSDIFMKTIFWMSGEPFCTCIFLCSTFLSITFGVMVMFVCPWEGLLTRDLGLEIALRNLLHASYTLLRPGFRG